MKNALFTLLVAASVAPLFADVPITPAHEAYLKRGIMAIVHWGPNTYIGREWGFGDADPKLIQPTDLNPAQWAQAMKAGGIKSVVLVAKHHDGFCLWPSEYNKDYSTTAMTGKYKGANVVRALEKACRRNGLAFGVYLSPWDRHQGSYGTPAYVEYFHNQWGEMFSGKYGDICEIWLDGANGGDGWYGGVNGGKGERRTLPGGEKYYQKPRLLASLFRHNPMAVAFGGHGRQSIMWCGNERGLSPKEWRYERKGEDGKMYFMPPEADTPLRGNPNHGSWFYHDGEKPKSLKQIVNCYFESVGHGGVLNFGIAPDKAGRICDDDVRRLKEFGDYVRRYNAVDFAKGAMVKETAGGRSVTRTLTLGGDTTFNAVDFGEDLSKGQTVSKWTVEVQKDGAWVEVAKGGTVGYRRIARFDSVTSRGVRVTCAGSSIPKIVRLAVRVAPAVRDDGSVEIGETSTANWMTGREKESR